MQLPSTSGDRIALAGLAVAVAGLGLMVLSDRDQGQIVENTGRIAEAVSTSAGQGYAPQPSGVSIRNSTVDQSFNGAIGGIGDAAARGVTIERSGVTQSFNTDGAAEPPEAEAEGNSRGAD